jgi:23S rRNA (pseudouridine1915-N3)-methyltransferase
LKLLDLCVGKPKDKRLASLHDEYQRRVMELGAGYASVWVKEERAGGRFGDEHVREREGRRILDLLNVPGTVVALDRSGRSLSSEQVAEHLERWAHPRVVFLVGGPLGLHGTVLERSRFIWSLSPLTLTHEWARALLAEQIFRAMTLLRGLPYHK